jgi:predicted DNA-binding transcriptional regulator
VQEHQPVRREQVAAHLGCQQDTAAQHLRKLRVQGRLQKRRIDQHMWVWVIAGAPPPKVAIRPLVQHKLQAHEQVASVWDYARRCGV